MIPKKWATEFCLVSVFSLMSAEVLPVPGDIGRLIRTLVHESRNYGPPPEPNTLAPLTATGNSSPYTLNYTRS